MQVHHILRSLCGDAFNSFLADEVTGGFEGLPLNGSTLTGVNDRATGMSDCPAPTQLLLRTSEVLLRPCTDC